MTNMYLEIAQKFMAEGKWGYAETALRRSLGFANKEKVATGNIFKALNYTRKAMV